MMDRGLPIQIGNCEPWSAEIETIGASSNVSVEGLRSGSTSRREKSRQHGPRPRQERELEMSGWNE